MTGLVAEANVMKMPDWAPVNMVKMTGLVVLVEVVRMTGLVVVVSQCGESEELVG